jgi:hypothetical protein
VQSHLSGCPRTRLPFDTRRCLLLLFTFYFLLSVLASISSLKFEAIKKGKSKTGAIEVAAIIEGRIMNLSVETKVAIAVATSFVVLIVGAMAQGVANAAAI